MALRQAALTGIMIVATAATGPAAAQEEAPAPSSTWREGTDTFMAGIMRGMSTNLPGPVYLPLKLTDVRIDVTAGVTQTDVRQTFVNDSDVALEVTYVFPLPSRAAVTDMQLLVGDRRIRSVVQEKKEARQTYEAARQAGKRAALLEQDRPNMFTTSLANILPGDLVEVEFSYTEPTEYADGEYAVTFPMLVGPRYIPFEMGDMEREALRIAADAPLPPEALAAAAAVPAPPTLPVGIAPDHRIHIEAIVRGLPIEWVRSSTHELTLEALPDGTFKVATTEDLLLPDGDFSLHIGLEENSEPTVTYLESRGDDGYAYGLLTLLPPTEIEAALPPAPRDVIFLVDTSGSMDGGSMAQAKAGLQECLTMLTADDHFTLVRFSDAFTSLSGELLPADAGALQRARDYVASLEAGGGTDMQPALAHALGIPGREEAMRMIVFLTDGCVGNEASLVRLLSEQLGRARLFTFGIGSVPNEFLMRTMAEMGRGQTRFIRSEEDVGWVMADFFKTLDTPVMTDVTVSWLGNDGVTPADIMHYPSPCPDVFRARPIQVACRLPADFAGTVTVGGYRDGEPITFTCDFAPGDQHNYPSIDRLFGRARISALMTERMRAGDQATRDALRVDVLETALRHQLISAFTSRVAVEDVVVRNPDGELATVDAPNVTPRGQGLPLLSATATQDRALCVLGCLIALIGGVMFREHMGIGVRA